MSNRCGSFGGPEPSPDAAWHAEESSGDVRRYETGSDDHDNFSQCREFFRNVLGPAERERLTDNIAGNLSGAQEFLQARAVANFAAVDAEYGRMIQTKLDRIKASKAKAPVARKCPHAAAAALSPPRSVPGKSNL